MESDSPQSCVQKPVENRKYKMKKVSFVFEVWTSEN